MYLSEMCEPLAPDRKIPNPAFILVVGPALAHTISPVIARAVHGSKRCPDFAASGRPWHTACTECADAIDHELARRDRKFRRMLVSTGTNAQDADAMELVTHLRGEEARRTPVAEASRLLLSEAKRHRRRRDPAQPWVHAAYRQLVYRPYDQVSADARRYVAARRGRAARPDRDLMSAKWARPLHDDKPGLKILVSFIIGVRDSVADPWAIPADSAGDLAPHEVSRRLNIMLRRLRDLRKEFYDTNVAVPLAQRDLMLVPPHKISDLRGARPIWAPGLAAMSPEDVVLDRLAPARESAPLEQEWRRQIPAAQHRCVSVAPPVHRVAGAFATAGLADGEPADGMPFMAQPGVARVLLAAVMILPLLLVVLLSAPAWLAMPFLSEPRRESIMTELGRIQRWHSLVFTSSR